MCVYISISIYIPDVSASPEGHVVVLLETFPHEPEDAAHLRVLVIPAVQEPAHIGDQGKQGDQDYGSF